MPTTKLSEESLLLKRISDRLENCSILNMYSNLTLIILGLVANLIALPILIYSKHRTPRIVGVNYLILLTISNTSYLVIDFYINTYNRLIYYFDLDYEKSWQLFDSCTFFCKLLPYLRYSTRLVNVMLTVGFSLERFIAVFWPLQMRALKWKFCVFLKSSIAISFILPIYLPFLVELVPNSELNILKDKYNLTTSFNLYSWMPFLGNSTCAPKKAYYPLLLKFHFFLFVVTLFSYLFIGASIFAIVLKLKKQGRFIFRDRSNRQSPDSYNLAILLNDSTNEHSNQPSNNEGNHSKCFNYFIYLYNRIRAVKNQNQSSQQITSKKQDTRILTSISVSYVIFNSPFFLLMILVLFFFINSADSDKSISTEDLALTINIRCALAVSEIFQLANFCITGFLFFFSGKAFRLHAFMFFKNIFNRFFP